MNTQKTNGRTNGGTNGSKVERVSKIVPHPPPSYQSSCRTRGVQATVDGNQLHLSLDGYYTGKVRIYNKPRWFLTRKVIIAGRLYYVHRGEYLDHLRVHCSTVYNYYLGLTYGEAMRRAMRSRLDALQDRIWMHLSDTTLLHLMDKYCTAVSSHNFHHAIALVQRGVPLQNVYYLRLPDGGHRLFLRCPTKSEICDIYSETDYTSLHEPLYYKMFSALTKVLSIQKMTGQESVKAELIRLLINWGTANEEHVYKGRVFTSYCPTMGKRRSAITKLTKKTKTFPLSKYQFK